MCGNCKSSRRRAMRAGEDWVPPYILEERRRELQSSDDSDDDSDSDDSSGQASATGRTATSINNAGSSALVEVDVDAASVGSREDNDSDDEDDEVLRRMEDEATNASAFGECDISSRDQQPMSLSDQNIKTADAEEEQSAL